eukprot:scaffold13.g358.t1
MHWRLRCCAGRGGAMTSAEGALAGAVRLEADADTCALLAHSPGLILDSLLASRSTQEDGLTVLQVACLRRRPELLSLLMEALASALADPELPCSRELDPPALEAVLAANDCLGEPPALPLAALWAGHCVFEALFAAAASGCAVCLQLLLGAPLLAQHLAWRDATGGGVAWGMFSLGFLDDPELAKTDERLDAFRFLLKSECSPAHVAAVMDNRLCLAALLTAPVLEAAGLTSAEQANAEGFTPLLLAAAANSIECLRFLLLPPASAAVNHRNLHGRSALFTAAVCGHKQALQILIAHGADVNAQESHALYSPLMMAVTRAAAHEADDGSGCPATVDAFLACAALLIAGGADVDLPAKDKTTPLHAASAGGSVTGQAMLLQSGADIEALDSSRRTPLLAAADKIRGREGGTHHARAVMMLLSKGARVPEGKAGAVIEALSLLGPSVWDMLELCHPHQLEQLTRDRAFFQLPHPPAPPPDKALPPASLAAALGLAAEGMANLTYGLCPKANLASGRRPAYLLELVQRAALAPGAAPRVRAAVAGSAELAGTARLWPAAEQLFAYAAIIVRCSNMAQAEREQMSFRLGNLLSAWHNLAAMLRQLRIPFSGLLDGSAEVPWPAEGGDAAACRPAPGGGRSGRQDAGLAQLLAGRQGDVEGLAAGLPTKQRLLLNLVETYRAALGAAPLTLSAPRGAVLDALARAAAAAGGGAALPATARLRAELDGEDGRGDGVLRELLRLAAGEMLDPGRALMESLNGGATYQPSRAGFAGPGLCYELAGSLIALALAQGCLLPGMRLSSHVWRSLLGPPDGAASAVACNAAALWDDLRQADPAFCCGLRRLEEAGDDLDSLGLFFVVDDGAGAQHELVPGGVQLGVTHANLARYQRLRAAHHLRGGAAGAAAAAMRAGLLASMPPDVASCVSRCFTHAELNLLVGGRAKLGLEDWKASEGRGWRPGPGPGLAHTRYDRCCEATPQIEWFWDAVARMDGDGRAALLAFVTGSSALPAGGFAALRGFNGSLHAFTVTLVASEGDGRLPRASTCFNHLFLPAFSSAGVLRRQLELAVAGAGVFDEAVMRQ